MSTKFLGRLAITVWAATAAAQTSDADHRARLEAARAKLDAAAQELAELHRESMLSEMGSRDATVQIHPAPDKDRPFIGVLLGGRDRDGITVAGVTPGSGAQEAGVVAGDVITAINGSTLDPDAPFESFHTELARVDTGKPVTLDVRRDGEYLTVNVTTYSRPRDSLVAHRIVRMPGDDGAEAERTVGIAGGPAFVGASGHVLGMTRAALKLVDMAPTLAAYFGVDSGVLVVDAPANGMLQPGDVLISVGEVEVFSSREAYRALSAITETAEIRLWRQHGQQVVDVAPPFGHGGYFHVDVNGAEVEILRRDNEHD